MSEIADGIQLLKSSLLSPNVYRLGSYVIDSGTRLGAGKLVKQLKGAQLEALVLTHVHPPTQGGSHELCTELTLALWCGEGDVATAESGDTSAAQPRRWFNPLQQRLFAGHGHPVARALKEGDEISGFTVLEVPGHAPGHIALWRERDRVLFLGDVITNQNVWTGVSGLREPPALFTPDVSQNRESARRLAALRPQLALFSHGPPLRVPDKLQRFVALLP